MINPTIPRLRRDLQFSCSGFARDVSRSAGGQGDGGLSNGHGAAMLCNLYNREKALARLAERAQRTACHDPRIEQNGRNARRATFLLPIWSQTERWHLIIGYGDSRRT